MLKTSEMIRKGTVAACQIQAFGDATINRRNQFQFGEKEKHESSGIQLLALDHTKKDWTPKKKGRRVHIEGQTEKGQTLKAGLLCFRGICQVSFHCSPFKTSVVNGAAIIRSSPILPAPPLYLPPHSTCFPEH